MYSCLEKKSVCTSTLKQNKITLEEMVEQNEGV